MEPVAKLKLPEPSNELEKQVADSIDKKPEEKKELFKAIFCDSDDDDDDEAEKEEEQESNSNKKITTLIENFIDPKAQNPFTRNDDKPQGIFKNIFEISRGIPTVSSKATTSSSQPSSTEVQTAPTAELIRKQSESSSTSESELDRSLLEKLKKSKSKKDKKKKKSREVIEEWVEAGKVDKKKHKKEKKKKKHKSKK